MNECNTSTQMEISKFYDDEQLVFGWASTCFDKDGNRPLDWAGDLIDPQDIEPGVYDFVKDYGVANDAHINGSDCGEIVESVFFTKEKIEAMGIPKGTVPIGWWVGFKINNREIYQKVKSGEYKMMSIEGSALSEETDDEPLVDYSKGGFQE